MKHEITSNTPISRNARNRNRIEMLDYFLLAFHVGGLSGIRFSELLPQGGNSRPLILMHLLSRRFFKVGTGRKARMKNETREKRALSRARDGGGCKDVN